MSQEANIWRAFAKLSSSLDNLHTLNWMLKEKKAKIFYGKMARDINRFSEFYNHHTAAYHTAVTIAHEEAYQDLVNYWIGGFDEEISATSEEKRQVCLFFIKAFSAQNDLKGLESSTEIKLLINPIQQRLSIILRDAFIRKVNVLAEDIHFAVKRLDALGKEIVID